AAKQATGTIPIVFTNVGNPVRVGIVESLARPGRNVTGLSFLGAELSGKRLELLKGTIPDLSRVAVFWNATNPGVALAVEELQPAAEILDLKLQSVPLKSPAELDGALQAILDGRAEAVFSLTDILVRSLRPQLVEFTRQHRLPLLSAWREDVIAGA